MNSYHLCGTILFLAELESCQYTVGHLSMAVLVFQEIEIDTMYEHIPSMITCHLALTQNSICYVVDFCVHTRLGDKCSY